MYRVFSLAVLLVALGVMLSASATGQEKEKKAGKGDSHVGKFISAEGNSFKMEDKGGKEHSHKLAANAKVTGPDGKECKIDDLERGQMIRVTTKEGDKTTAIKVEALKKKKKGAE